MLEKCQILIASSYKSAALFSNSSAECPPHQRSYASSNTIAVDRRLLQVYHFDGRGLSGILERLPPSRPRTTRPQAVSSITVIHNRLQQAGLQEDTVLLLSRIMESNGIGKH